MVPLFGHVCYMQNKNNSQIIFIQEVLGFLVGFFCGGRVGRIFVCLFLLLFKICFGVVGFFLIYLFFATAHFYPAASLCCFSSKHWELPRAEQSCACLCSGGRISGFTSCTTHGAECWNIKRRAGGVENCAPGQHSHCSSLCSQPHSSGPH